jgi:phytoene desaturase
MRIVVVGSGFGGLAAAVRLQAQGHDVTLLDKRDKAGGRAYVYEQDGFTFDAGPTVITAPWMIRELFELAGRNPDDYLHLVPVDPFYRIFFPDGGRFDYSGETARMVAQVAALSPGDVAGYLEFVRRSERIFAKGFVELADRPFLRPWDMVKIIPAMHRSYDWSVCYGTAAVAA